MLPMQTIRVAFVYMCCQNVNVKFTSSLYCFAMCKTAAEPDSYAMMMTRLYGASQLSSSIPWFLLHSTRDATVHITLIMSNVVSSSIEIMALLFTYFMSGKTKGDAQTSAWSDQYLFLFGLPTFLWMLGNLIHLLRSRDFNTYPQHNIRLNNHLRVDAWLLLILAVMFLAFPRQFFSLLVPGAAMSEVTLHFMRCKGALMIGEAIVSLQAPGFLHSRDKLALFTTRLLGAVLPVALFIAGVYLFNVTANLSYHGPLAALLAINALIARFTDGTTIYVVPTPSKSRGGLKSASGDVATPSKSKDKGAVQSGSSDTSKED